MLNDGTEYIAVDLEMTGLKASRDKILEIGAVRCKNGQVTARFQMLVNPLRKLPPKVIALTGITDAMAENGETLQRAMEAFVEFFGGLPLVGHNLMCDFAFLKQNAVNLGIPFEANGLDTLKLARQLLLEPEKKTMESLGQYFGFLPSQAHRALGDAEAVFCLLELLRARFAGSRPELFVPKPLLYRVKKQGPITAKQKKYLKELSEYHKIELPASFEGMTKNEASRLTDQILLRYGKRRR